MTSFMVPRVSRRALVGSSLAGAATLGLSPFPRVAAQHATPAASAPPPTMATTPPAKWRTWLLTSPDELRPAAPAPPSSAELADVLALQGQRTDETLATIRQWGARPAVLPWTELANEAYVELKLSALRQYRANGVLQVAMHDAIIAAFDAQDTYQQPAPATLDARITPVAGIAADRPAFPSAEAAVAGAAAAVLTALLPDATAGRFTELAQAAAESRLQAGVNIRRDIDAGLALGTAIGERAVAAVKGDRPGSEWDGSGRLTGPGSWQPTPPAFVKQPLEPLAGTWHRWLLERADQFRPAPPPAYGSSVSQSQLAAVQEAVARRTVIQAQQALYWQGSAASTLWDGFAGELIVRAGLDLPHAARVLAYAGAGMADTGVASWDAKYAYWAARPITADPNLQTLFPTPPFPSYPSVHATVSNAGATILAHFFPDDAVDLLALAAEAAASRGWAGIHFPIDNDIGLAMGRTIGHFVEDVARHDGAE
jgi:membrane-associated phospholipid phosphatase